MSTLRGPYQRVLIAESSFSSSTGIFAIADKIKRPLPTEYDRTTHERIHSSVQCQKTLSPQLQRLVVDHPDMVAPLLPLEEEIKMTWTYREPIKDQSVRSIDDIVKPAVGGPWSLLSRAKALFSSAPKSPVATRELKAVVTEAETLQSMSQARETVESSRPSVPIIILPQSPSPLSPTTPSRNKLRKSPLSPKSFKVPTARPAEVFPTTASKEVTSSTTKSEDSPIVVSLNRDSSKHSRSSSWFSRKSSMRERKIVSSLDSINPFARELVN